MMYEHDALFDRGQAMRAPTVGCGMVVQWFWLAVLRVLPPPLPMPT